MKKLICLIIMLVLLSSCSICHAVTYSYTLPEKLQNQLFVGSGLNGSFRISADGEKFNTPLINAISDADISVMGIFTNSMFYGYLFQTDEQEQQTGRTEFERYNDVYYIRSDMMPGKILQLPTGTDLLEALFPARGENPGASSFIYRMLSVSDQSEKENWETVLLRYHKELEFWLAEYAVLWQSVKQDSELTADFTYRIPVSELKELIMKMMNEFTTDTELSTLLDSVMTQEQKALYMNRNLLYYYQDALNALDLQQDLVIYRRTSTLGKVVSSVIDLPLDEKITGFSLLSIDSHDGYTAYTLKSEDKAYILVLPDNKEEIEESWHRSFWYAQINRELGETELTKANYAVKIDVQKTSETTEDENQKRHQNDRYTVNIQEDRTYIPEEFADISLTDTDPISIIIDLHYHSKYAQNSPTTLEFNADISQFESHLSVKGEVKTANSDKWVLNPFDVVDPFRIEINNMAPASSYLADWISNAASIIHHTETIDETKNQDDNLPPEEKKEETSEETGTDDQSGLPDDVEEGSETAPLEVPDGV